MKYLILIILIIIGVGIGMFVGLGGLEGVGWVAFIALFPLIYIFGTILLGKNNDDEVIPKNEKKSKWDKYE